ncbi:MAG TPA: SpoIIE family protein phosphatase [Pyrinomonadaceae bacterium]|nr:SpoIIE family protein phosphatase [Pyrinomonadaceae bacterium]
MKSKYAPYVPLAILFALAATYQARFSVDAARQLTSPTEVAQFPLNTQAASAVVSFVGAEAKQAGVHAGDRLLSVNGRAYTGGKVLGGAVADARPGDTMTVTLAHPEAEGGAAREETVAFRLAPLMAEGRSLGNWLFQAIMYLVMPAFCLLLGFWVAALRPRDLLAWLLLFLMMSFSVFLPRVNVAGWEGWLRVLGLTYFTFFFTTWPVWMMLFGVYFPEPLSYDRRWPWAKWLFLVPALAHAVLAVVIAVGNAESIAAVEPLARLIAPFEKYMGVLLMTMVGIFFMSLGMKYGTATTRDVRRRLRLLQVGTMLSLAPTFILVLRMLIFTGGNNPYANLPAWVVIPALLLVFLFPLTMAYVIVVHRAMDVRVVLRQGVQYALARNGVRVMQVILSAVVIFVAASLVASHAANRPQKIAIMAAGVMLVFLLQGIAERLRRFVDRRFFREAYNAEQILSDLSEKVRTIVETRPLLETVAERISESLHVPRVALMLKDGDGYRPAHALGYDEPPPVAFHEQAATVRQLRASKEPVLVYAEDADSWVHKTQGMENGERGMLAELGTQLLLPLAVKENLPGFISLGPKQSEEPYSNTDLRLLQSVATQTGLALENSQLTAAIAAEVAQRERLNREVEIAREVQERLFPQKLPQISGLDYSGACRPALGVGGDYYDFLLLPGGRFGIAVGDVSGKGIAAALLMASLQASLRGQAVVGTSDLAELMSTVNRLVYDASAENRYATFFYAQYEPQTRSLTYVNAGHNPPMILRSANGSREVLRLEAGGCVVGLLPNFPYGQACVTLEPGDTFIGFTDGISEAMNPSDEEWGEECMLEAARECDGLSASEIIARLIAAADEFAAGAKQHDDMTLVVVRVI